MYVYIYIYTCTYICAYMYGSETANWDAAIYPELMVIYWSNHHVTIIHRGFKYQEMEM